MLFADVYIIHKWVEVVDIVGVAFKHRGVEGAVCHHIFPEGDKGLETSGVAHRFEYGDVLFVGVFEVR